MVIRNSFVMSSAEEVKNCQIRHKPTREFPPKPIQKIMADIFEQENGGLKTFEFGNGR